MSASQAVSVSGRGGVVDINGEYVLHVESIEKGVRVAVAKARRRDFLPSANALIEARATQGGCLVAVEPIIDNVRFVITCEGWVDVLEALRAQRLGDRDYAALTNEGARRMVLERIAAAGGEVYWDEAFTTAMEEAAFPLSYRGRDAITDLVALGALVAVRKRGQPPRLRITSAAEQYLAPSR